MAFHVLCSGSDRFPGSGKDCFQDHRRHCGRGDQAEDPDHPRHEPLDPSSWYVQTIEPNDRGASEVRRLFWERVEEMFPEAARC